MERLRTFCNMARNFSATGVLAVVLSVAGLQSAQAEVSQRVGYAYDKQTGRFLYSETHHEILRDGRPIENTVVYRNDEGRVFAQKHIDFHKSQVMPDFQLVNSENGHVEGARGGETRLSIHFQKRSDSEVRKASVEIPNNGIVDAGFDRFIEENWAALADGKVLEREFLIPSQLEFYTFEIAKIASRESGEMAFRLQIKSLILQMFVPSVRVYYDMQTRSLLRYEGISNIRNNAGENFDVRIEFAQPTRAKGRVAPDTGVVSLREGRPPGEQLAVR